jgi:transcriptional antiterminator RfaH
MLRANDNPPSQYPEEAQFDLIDGLWWVVHTKPRQEKALARDLLRSSIPYFLPMYEARRRSRGRSWKAVLPLFPGYVFFCGDEDDRLKVLETGRVAKLIPVRDQARLVAELSSLRRVMEAGLGVDPYPALKTKSRCRVRSGPLQGMEGQVVRRKGKARFIVTISILGQGASVEIDGNELEPLH